jgi:hypothetical protein
LQKEDTDVKEQEDVYPPKLGSQKKEHKLRGLVFIIAPGLSSPFETDDSMGSRVDPNQLLPNGELQMYRLG